MRKLLYIGGPLILFSWWSFYSDLITIGQQPPGILHFGGVEAGGTFAIKQEDTYVCDENGNNCTLVDSTTEVTEVEDTGAEVGVSRSANYRLEEQSTGFSEVVGLEIESEPIEYRDGLNSDYNKTKQPGLTKYTNITMKRPTGFDWKTLRFEFQRQAAIEEINKEYDQKIQEAQSE
jgi:hypothetical protein